ncbi:Myc-type, basic helix-loop-helix domain-containing protein [Tanacetum coccineum]
MVNFDMMKPEFSGDARNVRLGLAADGFNPFGMMSQTYSTWPVILTTYNTPSWITSRIMERSLKTERRCLTLEVVCLGRSGKATTHGPTGNVKTPSMAVKNKIAYVGHRRFLRTQHPQRNKFKEYYGSKEPTPKPRKFSELEIQLQISKVLKATTGKHPDIAKNNPKPNREIEMNWSNVLSYGNLDVVFNHIGLDGEMYYGQLEEILELTYIGNRKVVLFRCKWFDTINPKNLTTRNRRSYIEHGIQHILTDREFHKNNQYILATQVTQYLPLRPCYTTTGWKVVEHVYHRDVAESDQDVIHGSSSSNVTLSVELTNFEHTDLSINSESTEVDAPPVNDDNANANEGNAEDDDVAHVLDDDKMM